MWPRADLSDTGHSSSECHKQSLDRNAANDNSEPIAVLRQTTRMSLHPGEDGHLEAAN